MSIDEMGKVFTHKAKESRLEVFVIGALTLLAVALVLLPVWVDPNEELVLLATLIGLGMLAVMGGLTVTYMHLVQRRAVKQCMAVSEVYGLGLTFWESDKLIQAYVDSASGVFERFVVWLERNHPETIPPHFFVGSGKTGDACRRLVEFLWEQKVQTSTVSSDTTDQHPATA